MLYIYKGILLSHKKEWNNAICSNMNGPRDHHIKWSKSERERQIPYDITYMWNLNYDKLTQETDTDSQHREWTCGCQGGKGVLEGWTGSLELADANYYI